MKAEKIPLSYYVLALTYLGEGSIGRYTLAERIGTTKAKIRRIFMEFADMDIVRPPGKSSGRRGTTLTSKGMDLLHQIEKKLKVYLQPKYSIPDEYRLDDHHAIVAIRDPTLDLNMVGGIFERDSAIRSGATGALILINGNDRWIFPNDGSIANVSPKPKSTDPDRVLIITFGSDNGNAIVSATETGLLMINTSEIENEIFS